MKINPTHLIESKQTNWKKQLKYKLIWTKIMHKKIKKKNEWKILTFMAWLVSAENKKQNK
jgi:hypothetical protein